MTDSVLGTCMTMCPEKERCMREREGLLHKLEIDKQTIYMKRPKADPGKAVKCFSRPAAGQTMPDPSQLRPAPVLLATIRYLFTEVITRDDFNWPMIYDFVFDRLRAIRQDVVIQRINGPSCIKILELIVRFHVYAGQRLCERSISEFDPKINSQHLLECLKRLLVFYDESDGISAEKNTVIEVEMERLSMSDSRPQMEALYILLHLGDTASLKRGLSLPPKCSIRKNVLLQGVTNTCLVARIQEYVTHRTGDVKLALKVSIAWYLRNYVRTFRLIKKLPPLLACAALSNLKSLRRNTLHIMSSGYNSKLLTFPGLKLQELLLYNDINRIRADCELFGLTFSNENIQFQKTKYNDNEMLANPEMYFNIQALTKLLPHVLFDCT